MVTSVAHAGEVSQLSCHWLSVIPVQSSIAAAIWECNISLRRAACLLATRITLVVSATPIPTLSILDKINGLPLANYVTLKRIVPGLDYDYDYDIFLCGGIVIYEYISCCVLTKNHTKLMWWPFKKNELIWVNWEFYHSQGTPCSMLRLNTSL